MLESPTIVAPPDLAETLAGFARECLPQEACGLLIGRFERARIVVEHATHGRNLAQSASRFELDPLHIVREDARARTQRRGIVAVWHSHPRTAARPSRADRAGAASEWWTAILSLAGDRPELRFWQPSR